MSGFDDERLGLEKRKHVRIDVELSAVFSIVGEARPKEYPARTRNISQGGLCLAVLEDKERLAELFRRASPPLRVALELSESEAPLQVGAKTAWISSKVDWMYAPPGEHAPLLMGLAYLELEDDVRDAINSFIADMIIRRRIERRG